MRKNGAKEGKDEIIEFEGHQFDIVKMGVDTAQITDYVKELTSQRDALAQREEHFSSLTKLAERTVTEADRLAKEMKQEAGDQARAEAKEIMARAAEEAQQMIEEKRAEIVTIANEEAIAIRAGAQQEAKELLEDQRSRIKPEIKAMAQQLYGQLLSQFENLKQQVGVFEEQFETKLSQITDPDSTTTTPTDPPLVSTPATVVSDEGKLAPDITAETSLEDTGDIGSQFEELIQAIGSIDTSDSPEKAPVLADNQNVAPDNRQVELEILPPLDITKIMGIIGYLDNLPEIETTELIPSLEKPSIIVFQRQPIRLADILGKLPEVGQVREYTSEEVLVTGTAGTEARHQKIEIKLS